MLPSWQCDSGMQKQLPGHGGAQPCLTSTQLCLESSAQEPFLERFNDLGSWGACRS